MNLVLAWNELAETSRAPNKLIARMRMDGFVDTFAALRARVSRYVAKPVLRCRTPLDEVELAVDYRIANWRNDTDRTRRMLFLALATASPFLLSAEEGGSSDQFGSEAMYAGIRAEGLHSAWVWSGLGLSLASEPCWDVAHLQVEINQLDPASVFAASVRHASTPGHVLEHEHWLESQARESVSSADDLWLRRDQLFPHLDFCPEVEKTLLTFDAGSPHLRQILLRLFELERAFASWNRSPVHPAFVTSKCTPETPQTLLEEANDHTAVCPSGEQRLFSWHVRFTPGAGRIFFDGDTNTGRGLVGIIVRKKGAKLG